MKIVYMGTPEFAVPALAALAAAGHEIKYAVTRPDKARDRGNKIKPTPVKEKAEALGIPVLQPESLKDGGETAGKIKSCGAELIVAAAYGQILPPDILMLPEHGCLNIHASLLPRWRGADPIRRAVIEGDEETGVTIMYMDEGLDTGDIAMKESVMIGEKTADELYTELSVLGAKLMLRAIDEIAKGTAARAPQDEKLATYAHMISKSEGALDFNKSPEQLVRLIRGVSAYTSYRGETMKVWEAFSTGKPSGHKAGAITGVSEKGIEVSAGGGTLLITGIQMPGKKRMKIDEYLKGNKVEKFVVLE